jgi:hypothetical protein
LLASQRDLPDDIPSARKLNCGAPHDPPSKGAAGTIAANKHIANKASQKGSKDNR